MKLGLGLGLSGGNGGSLKVASFISTWKTDNLSTGSSNNNQVKLPLVASGNYNFVVDWGDSSQDTITLWNQAETTHTYSSIDTYTITIVGVCEGWQFNNTGDRLKLLTIEKWGKFFTLGVNGSHFHGCENLQINATNQLKLGTCTDLSQAFRACTSLTTEIIKFDNTTNVTTMWAMFYGCSSFNGSLEYLYTDSCLYLSDMFGECNAFNKPVNHFDTSNVTSMYAMFYNCYDFNQEVSNWDTSNVTNMISLFNGCNDFNRSVSNFDTSGCSDMYAFFNNCNNFNQSVSNFDTSNVTNMTYMFRDCYVFNQDLSNFNTANVTVMVGMFYGCTAFNGDISNFNTANVTDMYAMFYNCVNFNKDISNFNIEACSNVFNMLQGATSWSTSNYDAFLIEIANNQNVVDSLTFHCSSYYTAGGSAESARSDLISTDLWTINDLGHAA